MLEKYTRICNENNIGNILIRSDAAVLLIIFVNVVLLYKFYVNSRICYVVLTKTIYTYTSHTLSIEIRKTHTLRNIFYALYITRVTLALSKSEDELSNDHFIVSREGGIEYLL